MSRQFQLDLCKALGLDPNVISELSITCVAGKSVEVRTVSYLIKPKASVETITRSFKLVERSDDEVGESLNPTS